jgi:hypothetical protein
MMVYIAKYEATFILSLEADELRALSTLEERTRIS